MLSANNSKLMMYKGIQVLARIYRVENYLRLEYSAVSNDGKIFRSYIERPCNVGNEESVAKEWDAIFGMNLWKRPRTIAKMNDENCKYLAKRVIENNERMNNEKI